MRGRLLYRDADGREAAAEVVAEGSFVGRAQECAVRTDDAMVSRRNCRIWREAGQWLVEDLGSSNGTFVNEQRVKERHPLRHADIIRCGTLQVRFVEVEDLPSDRVAVDPALMGDQQELEASKRELEAVLADRSEKEQQLFEMGRELEMLRLRTDNDAGELQRLRAEVVAQREKVGELSRVRQLTDEELNAQVRVGEQLRRDLEGLRKEHVDLREKQDKTSGDLQARDRQLERSFEDVQRTKQTLDEVRGRLAELEKTKDAGWRELNNRVGELDGLRAVIAEQERLLEERRVGLISLEASAQDLRQDKEKLLRELTVARSEREEAKSQVSSTRNQLEGIEEEHRRLQRALSEGSGGSADESLKLAADLRQSRVALKTLEAERDRLVERVERAEQARTEVEQKLAKLDVERTHALEEKQRAISARERADEAAARAELQRKVSEDTRRGVEASDAKLAAEVGLLRTELDAAKLEVTAAMAAADEARQALVAARAALGEETAARKKAEAAVGAPVAARLPVREQHRTMPIIVNGVSGAIAAEPPVSEPEDLTWNGGDTWNGGERPRVADPRPDGPDLEGAPESDARVLKLEEELAHLGAELALTRAELDARRGDHPGAARVQELKQRAEDAYHAVNDALSELRTQILLARRLAGELGADSEAARSLDAAILASIDRTEDAKGVLRTLREVVEA